MNNHYILLSEKEWHIELCDVLSKQNLSIKWTLINTVDIFTLQNLNELKPHKIFIPHWSHIIPQEIHKTYDCIVFHMTDLPYGRGGSPLQNLIIRGHKNTKISALKVENGIDTGPIYLKKDLNLNGTAQQIFEKATNVIEIMITEIIENKIVPTPQKGKTEIFKRRTPEMSNICEISSIDKIYDYIRMLDAVEYPNAYIENDYFKFTFTKAKIIDNKTIEANVKIIKK
jgi:methionyl-tRNA formyltransferase